MSATAERPVPRLGGARRLLLGGTAIMLLCQVFYGALQFSTLGRLSRESVLSGAGVVCNSMVGKISLGVRLGKNPDRFAGLVDLLAETRDSFPSLGDVLVLDSSGGILRSLTGATLSAPPLEASDGELADGVRVRSMPGGYMVYKAIRDKKERIVGYGALLVPKGLITENTAPVLAGDLGRLALFTGLAFAALMILLRFMPLADAAGNLSRPRILAVLLVCVMGAQTASAVFAVRAFRQEYQRLSLESAARLSSILATDVQRIMDRGVPMEGLRSVGPYLERIRRFSPLVLAVAIENSAGRAVYRSMGHGERFGSHSTPLRGLDRAVERGGTETDWRVSVTLSRTALDDAFHGAIMDSLTMEVIALLFLMEMFLLLFGAGALVPSAGGSAGSGAVIPQIPMGGRALPSDAVSGAELMRPLVFTALLALDMSISFIPLRMGQLPTAFEGLPLDVLLGLPVSAEMAMAGLAFFLGGFWLEHAGTRRAMVRLLAGSLGLCALGCAASALAASAEVFIVARGLVGAGYGLMLMAAQIFVVRHSPSDTQGAALARLFAGVYAGSLCGSVVGGMLADRLGFVPVFFVAGSIMAALALAVFLGLRNQGRAPLPFGLGERCEEKAIPLTCSRLRQFLGDRRVMAFMLLSAVPGAFMAVGFLNYFLPVYLSRSGMSQSGIGRMFMLYCLTFVYIGPILGPYIDRARNRAVPVALGGLTGACGVLCFVSLEGVWAPVAGSFFLGLSMAVCIAAQNAYLLSLRVSNKLGISRALSLYNAAERIGQVLGPLCLGSAMAAVGIRVSALYSGAFFILLALLFLVLGRERRPSAGAVK